MPPLPFVPIDARATPETKNLYANLHRLRSSKTIFGHHDSLVYGVGWTADNPGTHTSDVADSLTNKDMPGIFGWDIGQIETGNNRIINYVDLNKLRQCIKQVYDMGCISTICWHAFNPLNCGGR